MSTLPATPELDKLRAVQDESQVVHEFLSEWLPSQGIHLMRYGGGETPFAIHETPESLIARFLGIDLLKVESERRVLLDYLREQP